METVPSPPAARHEVGTKMLKSELVMLSSTHKCGTGEAFYVLKLDKLRHWHRTVFSQVVSNLFQASAKSNHSFLS